MTFCIGSSSSFAGVGKYAGEESSDFSGVQGKTGKYYKHIHIYVI